MYKKLLALGLITLATGLVIYTMKDDSKVKLDSPLLGEFFKFQSEYKKTYKTKSEMEFR